MDPFTIILLGAPLVISVHALSLRQQLWQFLFPDWVRTGFFESGAWPPGKDAAVDSLRAELRELGFAELGVRWERGSILGAADLSLCFASERDRAFASVFAVGERPILFLLSTFRDGTVALVGNYAGEQRAEDDIHTRYLDGGSAAEVQSLHRSLVSLIESRGKVVDTDLSHEGRLEACRRYYRTVSVRRSRRSRGSAAAIQIAGVVAALGVGLYVVAR